MEEGLEDINDGLESLRTKTKDAESALSAQNQLLQKLDSGFQEMEKVLSSHNDIMDELTDMRNDFIIYTNAKLLNITIC